MKSFSSLSLPPAARPANTGSFRPQLSALYDLLPANPHVFGSPLGPLKYRGRALDLPRFAFFGPGASDESWRLAFLGGFDHRDLRSSRALLALTEQLVRDTESGHGLNLALFPLLDVAGLVHNAGCRGLADAHWGWSRVPEIAALEKDARVQGYHGFVRVETAPRGEEEITIRVREPLNIISSPDVEIISSEETAPFSVRFERAPRGVAPADGPLTIADDLPVQPFELTLRIPSAWPDERYIGAVTAILQRFIQRYRAFQAYGQHL